MVILQILAIVNRCPLLTGSYNTPQYQKRID